MLKSEKLKSPVGPLGASMGTFSSRLMPLLKFKWVEMGDPAPPHRRTHGGTGAGALATIATGGPMGCSPTPCAGAKPLAGRYITPFEIQKSRKFLSLVKISFTSKVIEAVTPDPAA